MAEDDRMLTTLEVSQRLRISPDLVLTAINNGRLPAIRVGTKRRARIREADLLAWIAKGAPTTRDQGA